MNQEGDKPASNQPPQPAEIPKTDGDQEPDVGEPGVRRPYDPTDD